MPPKRAAAAAAAAAAGKRSKPSSSAVSPTPSPTHSTDSDASEATESDLETSHSIETPSPRTSAAIVDTHDVSDTTPFDGTVSLPSGLPIFRCRDIAVQQPAVDKTEAELAEMTFTQYLEWFLSHPSMEKKQNHISRASEQLF